MKKSIISYFLFLFFILSANAQNPIVPAGMYIADPSAHVWNDGKLYVYGSLDESADYYCSYRHNVLSTTDLINWEITEDVFSSRGKNDQIPYSDALLFAPDCQYKNGKYFLYYCLPDRNATEGVAIGNSPTGPFINGQKIKLKGTEEIDPCVFIDDDGQAYYIWGQFQAKIAKLRPNMTEIDTSTIVDNLVTEQEHFFHEGGYMVKRKGIYYFIYSHMGRGNRPTCIGYSTSNSPMGPFKYGGVIIDNNHCDPQTWNNHGSIIEYNGQWYVFYHRSTHNSRMMRKTCVEPIYFNDDGSINEVEMTSQGAGPPLSAFKKIDAERACLLFGNVRIQQFEPLNEELGGIKSTDNVAYKYVDFKDGAEKVTFRIKPLEKGGFISIHLDQPWKKSVGKIEILTGKNSDWQIYSAKIEKIKGIHAVWLKFYGKENNLFEVDWFRFEKQ